MVRPVITAFMLIFLSSSAYGFVEKLQPNNPSGGGIPCHGITAALRLFITPGGPSASVLSSIIQREWVPGGWSQQDIDDNTTLISNLNSYSSLEKIQYIGQLDAYCILWELGVDEVDSPEEFRQRMDLD